MSLAIPTASSMKLRFPEFADIDDAVVEFAIEEASLTIGDGENWTSGVDIAMIYLVAHYLSASVVRAGSGGSGSESLIQSESFGRLSITYAADANSSATAEDVDSSSYGRRYLDLVGANFAGPYIV